MDYYKKLALYQGAGVREYWIVDPAREIIVVYDFPNETPPTIYRFNDSVKVNIYEDFSIDFSQLKLWYHCRKELKTMSNRDLAKSLIDQIPEGKLVFIIPYLQGAAIPDEIPNTETLEAFAELENCLLYTSRCV